MKKVILLLILFTGFIAITDSCKEKDNSIPSVTTTAVTSATINSLTSGGTITSDGGAEVTEVGVCYSTSAGPTISGTHTTEEVAESFVSTITALEPNTLYYIRAYATNSVGTAYGDEVTATTSPAGVATLTTTNITAITLTSAVSGGNITANGGAEVTARGVCWSTSANPTTADSKTTDGTGTGTFVSNITGLTAATTYHVRAYATNSAGTAYGNDITFTATPVSLATLTTTAISAITLTTAVSGGTITADGGGTITARGVCWGTTTNPTIADSKTTEVVETPTFTSNITGLLAGTLYHVRAYATNAAGTAYGNDLTFTSGAANLPTLTTTAPSLVTLTTAASGGSITSDGGGAITASGICWSTTAEPTILDAKTTDGTPTGNFTSNMTGLTAGGTLYYIRAYATNSTGTSYGNQVTLTTNVADAEVVPNTYKTVLIGTQIWMAENLKTTVFNDGAAIPIVADNTTWSSATTPAYCWFNNDIANKDIYGAMYNWFTVNTHNLCPTGWHVPSDNEFNALQLTLGMPPQFVGQIYWVGTDQGTQLKSSTAWDGTNTSGFNALPGGYRYALNGTFNNLGNISYWWTSTEAGANSWYRQLETGHADIYRGATSNTAGKYVRCMKD